MLIKVQSDSPIDGLTLKKIIDIFNQSLCPNESLKFSIPRFTFFRDGTVQIGNGNRYFEVLNVSCRSD